MYGKVEVSSPTKTFQLESKVPHKNEDYVYLALVNNGQLQGDHLQEPTGCRLSPGRCLDRVTPGTSTNPESIRKRHQKLLIASGVTNAALLSLLLPLGAICIYLVLTHNSYSRPQENDGTFGNASCMVPHLCSDALWDQFQDHFYWFSWQHVTWAQAREKCRHLGTDLVSIHSKKENDFLVKKMLTKFRPGNRASGYYFWIGLMRDITTSDQPLVWVDGSGATFQLWSPHQPDNQEGLEHCGQSSLSPGNRGHWADRRCWTQQPFVCKRRIAGNQRNPLHNTF